LLFPLDRKEYAYYLKEAGVDMTTPAPILDAFHIFDGLLDNLS